MSWIDGPMLLIDIETTGTDPFEARIVTVSAVWVNGSRIPIAEHLLVNPGVDIPEEASAVHGITNEMAIKDGCSPLAAIRMVRSQMKMAQSMNSPVVAYNASYDLTVIKNESVRHLGVDFGVNCFVLDPFVIDRHIDKYRKGSRKLEDACAYYGVKIGTAHNSIDDALAAGRVLYVIANRYPEIGDMSLLELQEQQTIWHRERQESYIEYLRREGKEEDASCVSVEWPIQHKQ